MAGKADWGSAGLPLEGGDPSSSRVGAFVRRDVPTCRPDERLADVRERTGAWETCLVLDDDGVVLGRIGRSALRRDDDVTAEEAMTSGPSTIRPSARLTWAVERMRERDLATWPVTTSEGRLVGLLYREDAERALGSAD